MVKQVVSEEDKKVGEKVKEIRKRLSLSQRKVGAMIGITGQQIGKIEIGQNRLSASKLIILCKELEIDISEFCRLLSIDKGGEISYVLNETETEIIKNLRNISNKSLHEHMVALLSEVSDITSRD